MVDISLQGNGKVTIPKKTLEESLAYLTCSKDGEQFKLNVGKREDVDEGEFICTKCSELYEIEKGVPRFVKSPRQYRWDPKVSDEEIAQQISQSVAEPQMIRAQVSALGTLLYERFGGDRLQAIRRLFDIVTSVIKSGILKIEQQIALLVAANEARYDLEIYRNALIVPYEVLASAVNNYGKDNGIVFEGGCATGDCLLYVANAFPSKFFIGADISTNLIRQAQLKAGENILFIQADVHSLPIRPYCVETLIEQNIWDRLANPPKVVEEIGRVLSQTGSVILSQCDPPQYESEDRRIVYVPEGKRLSLKQIIDRLGFKTMRYQKVIWTPWTVYDGQETLLTDSYHAKK